jgi:hypothetical protein
MNRLYDDGADVEAPDSVAVAGPGRGDSIHFMH